MRSKPLRSPKQVGISVPLTDIFQAPLRDPLVLWLRIAWLFNASIQTWGKRIVQRRKFEETGSFSFGDLVTRDHWAAIRYADQMNVFIFREQIIELRRGALTFVSWLHFGLLVALAILNWQWTVLLYSATFVLAVLPVLESVGALLSRPFCRVLRADYSY